MVKSFKRVILALSMLAVGNAYTMATRAAQAGARAVQTVAPAGTRGISWARVWRGRPTSKNVTMQEAQEIARNAQKAVREGGDPRVAVRDYIMLASAALEARLSGREKEASKLTDLSAGIFKDLKKYMPTTIEAKQRAKDALAHPSDLGILKAYREMEASQLLRYFLRSSPADPEAYRLERQLREYVEDSSPKDIGIY